MNGGSKMKIHDVLALIGVLIIVATTLYIDVIIGAYVIGGFLIAIAFLLAKTYTPPEKRGGDR